MSWQVTFRQMVENPDPGYLERLLRLSLWPAARFYEAAATWRRRAYETGWLWQHRAARPVISVGNLTAGGTGKTPFVAALCRLLSGMRRQPAVLLRGYGAAQPLASDEAQLYRQLLPATPIYANADRVRSSYQAIAAGADTLVLDDGFQHLRLRRDIDIVLIDALCPFGGGQTLPAGMLREGLPTLRRADLIGISRADLCAKAQLATLQERLRLLAPHTPQFICAHRPARLVNLLGERLTPEELAGVSVAALCGIGRPEGFVTTLRELGARVETSLAFADHQIYREASLRRVLAKIPSHLPVIITEKDAVKIAALAPKAEYERLHVLGVDVRVTDMPQLREWLAQQLAVAPVKK